MPGKFYPGKLAQCDQDCIRISLTAFSAKNRKKYITDDQSEIRANIANDSALPAQSKLRWGGTVEGIFAAAIPAEWRF
jgi:hypothetical protein